MRGKAPDQPPVHRGGRITPAYAGKSWDTHIHNGGFWDHPRLCGEKNCTNSRDCCSMGSPPPMRGKVNRLPACLHNAGITPAYAGKSRRGLWRFQYLRDHPRLCGEKCRFFVICIGLSGSPPPMRGKATLARLLNVIGRITPAYAGKSTTNPKRKRGERDHPRLCGEKCGTYVHQQAGLGSPPPMRGKAFNADFFVLMSRITPAYAGKSR